GNSQTIASHRAAVAGHGVLGHALRRVVLEVIVGVRRGVGVGDAVDARTLCGNKASVAFWTEHVLQAVRVAAGLAGVIAVVGGIQGVARAVLDLGELEVAKVAVGDDAIVISVLDLADGGPAGSAVGAAAQDHRANQAGVGLTRGDITIQFRFDKGTIAALDLPHLAVAGPAGDADGVAVGIGEALEDALLVGRLNREIVVLDHIAGTGSLDVL